MWRRIQFDRNGIDLLGDIRRIKADIREKRAADEVFSNEYEQFVVRIVIYTLLWTYFLILGPYVLDQGDTAVGAKAALGFASLGSFLSIIHFLAKRTRNMPRIYIGMFLDIFCVSIIIIAGGALTAPFVLFYLWITFGNGFRFGNAALLFCAASCFVCFLPVFYLSSYWSTRVAEGISVIVSLVVLPLYASVLVRKLVKAKAEAEAANDAKSRFLATMSHELRTPLNGVIGLSSLLGRTRLSTEQRDMVTSIGASGSTLLELVNDVLDLARIEAGKQTYAPEPVDLFEFASAIERIIAPQAQMKSIGFNVFIDSSAPRYIVSERRHLQKILINLCGNAVKFTSEGAVTLAVSTETEGARKRLTVSVKDSGVGIVESELEAVFERFTQAKHTGKNVEGGTGLGLAITRELVTLLGGEIGVRSVVGEGSDFHFWLPLAAPDVEEAPDASLAGLVALSLGANAAGPELAALGVEVSELSSWAELCQRAAGEDGRAVVLVGEEAADAAAVAALRADISRSGRLLAPLFIFLGEVDAPAAREAFLTMTAGTPDAAALRAALTLAARFVTADFSSARKEKVRPISILVAEDNEVNRQVISRMLREFGHSVTLAADGDKALDALERSDFDLVLMDVNMPVIDGVEATKIFRMTEDRANRTPVVALTADVTDDGRRECVEAGMDDVIYKPVTLEGLTDIILKHVADAKMTEEEAESAAEATGFAAANVVAHPAFARSMQAEADVIDPMRLEELRALDEDGSFLRTLVESFLTDASDILNDAKFAVETGDVKRLQDARHALRSTALNIGAAQISALCEEARSIGAEAVASSGAAFVEDASAGLEDVRQRLSAEIA